MKECARKKKAKIPESKIPESRISESRSPGVFQLDIEELTFLKNNGSHLSFHDLVNHAGSDSAGIKLTSLKVTF